jgi:2-polyprenyl-3-methyl-5-hydroxy-6-metoxy-1,4-benzoquinol methylase
VVVCTQVVQYAPSPRVLIAKTWAQLKPGGVLLLTGPTNWPEVEPTDLWRLTRAGIETVLHELGWKDIVVFSRHGTEADGQRLSYGWAARAVRPT